MASFIDNYPNYDRSLYVSHCPPVKTVNVSIDRIQLSMKPEVYRVLSLLMQDYLFLRGVIAIPYPSGDLKAVVHKFESFSGTRIHLTEYLDYGFWISMQLLQPKVPDQQMLMDLFHGISRGKDLDGKVSITQIEFAIDLYPKQEGDLHLLKAFAESGLTLKYARPGAYNVYENTLYGGKGGNARKGPKGFRCYVKQDKDGERFVRLELQLNKDAINSHGLCINDFPILPSDINPFDFITYRSPLDRDSFNRFLNSVSKALSKKQGWGKRTSRSAGLVYFSVQARKYDEALSIFDTPVWLQHEILKKAAKQFNLNVQLSRYLPTDDEKNKQLHKMINTANWD